MNNPRDLILEYLAAFKAIYKTMPAPHIYAAGGWYTFKTPRTPPRKYRRREVEAMRDRLRERAALSPPYSNPEGK